MVQEKVTVRTHIHRIGASVIKEIRKDLFQNTDFVALGIKCQEFALFLVCKIINAGEISENGFLQKLLNLASMKIVLIKIRPGLRIFGVFSNKQLPVEHPKTDNF